MYRVWTDAGRTADPRGDGHNERFCFSTDSFLHFGTFFFVFAYVGAGIYNTTSVAFLFF